MPKILSTIASEIESLLFVHGEPLRKDQLGDLLAVSPEEIAAGLALLRDRYEEVSSGLVLLENDGEVKLATRPDNASVVESCLQKDREATLGKATLETLSVIAYRAPVSRADIDAIRGVNSSSALRALLLRGLIERQANPMDRREYVFAPSFRFLETLGISHIDSLPDYESLSREKIPDASLSEEESPDDASKDI